MNKIMELATEKRETKKDILDAIDTLNHIAAEVDYIGGLQEDTGLAFLLMDIAEKIKNVEKMLDTELGSIE